MRRATTMPARVPARVPARGPARMPARMPARTATAVAALVAVAALAACVPTTTPGQGSAPATTTAAAAAPTSTEAPPEPTPTPTTEPAPSSSAPGSTTTAPAPETTTPVSPTAPVPPTTTATVQPPTGGDYAAVPGPQVFIDDMTLPGEAFPRDVPAGYDWRNGPKPFDRVIPAQRPLFVNAWGHLYVEDGSTPPQNCRVELADPTASTIVDGAWRVVQTDVGSDGGAFAADYQGPGGPSDQYDTPAGTKSVGAPLPGFNFHFWPKGPRGELSDPYLIASAVRARLVPADPSRPDDCDSARFVLQFGADYFGARDGNNPVLDDVAIGRLKLVTREWRWFTMATTTPEQILANPPVVR